MKHDYNHYKTEVSNWVQSVRQEFDCDQNPSLLKLWEYILLLCTTFSKEILNFLVALFGEEEHRTFSSLFNVYPLTYELFWLLVLKMGLGYIVLMYFQIKYHGTNTIWHIWIFWLFCIFQPVLGSMESRFDIVNGIAAFIRFSAQFLFFIYFFAIDTVHLDSLKLLIWEDLEIDPITGRVYRTPYSKVSKTKLKKLGLTVLSIVGTAMLLLMIAMKIVSAFTPTSPGGETKPENQKQIEEVFKKQWLNVIFSSIIVAPILEEWVYRRFIMKSGQFKWWTILVSGFIFGLIHLRAREGLIPLIPYIIPGIIFATSLYISKNIWHTIIAHSLYNTITVISMLIRG